MSHNLLFFLVRTPPKAIQARFDPPDSPPHAQREHIQAVHPIPSKPLGNIVGRIEHKYQHVEEKKMDDFVPPKPVVMGGGRSPENRVVKEIVTSELAIIVFLVCTHTVLIICVLH